MDVAERLQLHRELSLLPCSSVTSFSFSYGTADQQLCKITETTQQD